MADNIWTKLYSRINWKNRPSRNTPINETNLGKIDYALDEIDDRVISLYGLNNELKGDLDTLEFGEVAGGKNKVFGVSYGYINSSGYYFIDNDSTSAICYLENGKTYKISCNIKPFADNIRIGKIYSKIPKNGTVDNLQQLGKGIDTFTSNFTGYAIVYTYASKNENVINSIQIEEGTQATDYEPYIPSVKMLSEEVKEQNESLSALGKCKNLLNPTLQTTTQNGVTCTNNGDGTYTVNGTSTAKFYFPVGTISTVINNGKTFKLTGCPVGGSTSTYNVSITDTVNPETVAMDYGTGAIKTIKKFDNKDVTYVFITIESGVTLNNVVFKPMLTSNLSTTYDDFVPYTGDGETLTADIASLKNDLGGLSFSVSGTTLSITDGTNTWTLEAN